MRTYNIPSERLADRFWCKVDKGSSGGCWVWTAHKHKLGYGRFMKDGKVRAAHRVAYELTVGPIPPGMMLDHKCNNRGCVNPDHLRPCTQFENMRNSKLCKTNTSGFKCVFFEKKTGHWIAHTNINGRSRSLGTFTTPNSAHIAYRNYARTHNGEFVNFG